MATPGGLVDKQELIDAQLDTAHLGRVVNSKDASGAPINTSTNRTGGVNKTLDALEAEYQGDIDNFVQVSDQLIIDKTAEFDASIATKEAEADAAIDEYRLLNKGPYAVGITLNSKFEFITYSGESYFASNPPYTTTATLPDADPNLFVGAYVNASQAESIAKNTINTLSSLVFTSVSDMVSGPTIVGRFSSLGATVYERVGAPSDLSSFKLRTKTYSSDFATIQEAVNSTPDGTTLSIIGDYNEVGVTVDKNILIELNNNEFTGTGYDEDIFVFTRGPKFTGVCNSSNHRLFCRVIDCTSNDDFIFDLEGSSFTDCYGVVGGRPSIPKNPGRIYLNGFSWSDCEIAVYFNEYIFKRIQYSGLSGDDMRLKPLSTRPSGYFDKYYCGGVFIDAQGGVTQASVGGSVCTNINYTGIDPFDNQPVTASDVEVHFFAVLCGGNATMTGDVVFNLESAQAQDNEGLLLRAERAVMSSCIAVNAGGNEGSLYTKGSTYSKMSDNIIAFTSAPASNSDQRGAIVTSPYIEGYNNTLINCGRGFSVRGTWSELKGNHYVTCISPAYLALEQASALLLQSGETYDKCATTATLNTLFTLSKYRMENPTILLDDDGTLGSWGDDNVKRYEWQGGTVTGTNNSSKTGLLSLSASLAEKMVIKGLDVDNVRGNGITTSVIRANANLKNLTISGIDGDKFDELIRLRDRTFDNLKCSENCGFDGTGATLNDIGVTVTGKDVRRNND